MMTKAEFMEGIHILQDNYNKQFTGTQLKTYYDNLKDMSKETYINNIKEIIRNNRFVPTIAEIRRIEQRKQFSDYQQRDYENIDFNKFYVN